MMFRRLMIAIAVPLVMLGHSPANAGTAEFWRTYVGPTRNAQDAVSDIWIGAMPGCQDGYDGQFASWPSGSGIALSLY